jgi:hypothetical protein
MPKSGSCRLSLRDVRSLTLVIQCFLFDILVSRLLCLALPIYILLPWQSFHLDIIIMRKRSSDVSTFRSTAAAALMLYCRHCDLVPCDNSDPAGQIKCSERENTLGDTTFIWLYMQIYGRRVRAYEACC